jgi:glycine/D-amino acid oxidase-like deaminating enzyme
MKRIFSDFAYGAGPRQGCWWDETIDTPDWPVLQEAIRADVAIIGAGFTGMSAALHLAEAGVDVVVLEAETPGWGASGRNGGFCCLGGAKIDDETLRRTYGLEQARAYRHAEIEAVGLVADLIDRLEIEADTHSRGETQLAHRPSDMDRFRKEVDALARETGQAPGLIEKSELAAHGLNGPFHGALTTPVGFGLNPRKYLFGLAAAAQSARARLFRNSRVERLEQSAKGFTLTTPQGRLRAEKVLIATNGYSSDDMPDWLSGRYLPSQSNVLVTRPLTEDEIAAQGWSSHQMAYDTRNLLHYFRLMPDRRFLFGMRGGLMASPDAERRARRRTRQDFERMFPSWRDVPSPHQWSGMVCLARNRVPFVGPVPGLTGAFAGLAYHGNGVAMGSYSGKLLSELALSRRPELPYPDLMSSPMGRFPMGRLRRLIMPAAYLYFWLKDL